MAKARICSVEGCNKKVFSRGWCQQHYGYWWRKGKIPTRKSQQQAKEGKQLDYHTRERSLLSEYKRVKEHYNKVVGMEQRMYWRKQLKRIEEDAKRNGIDIKKAELSITESSAAQTQVLSSPNR